MEKLTREQKMEYTYKQFLKAKREVDDAITKMHTFMKLMYAYA